jgi:hypothetical protein
MVELLHVHVYPMANLDDQVADLDVEMFDEQPGPDGYKQFGFERGGEWYEIRVPTAVVEGERRCTCGDYPTDDPDQIVRRHRNCDGATVAHYFDGRPCQVVTGDD